MTLDKITREAVIATVRKAIADTQEMYQEKWLTGDQLCAEIPFFTKEWLKRYGRALPRECVRVVDADGNEHRTGWCYPQHKILRMVAEGSFRSLCINQ